MNTLGSHVRVEKSEGHKLQADVEMTQVYRGSGAEAKEGGRGCE